MSLSCHLKVAWDEKNAAIERCTGEPSYVRCPGIVISPTDEGMEALQSQVLDDAVFDGTSAMYRQAMGRYWYVGDHCGTEGDVTTIYRQEPAAAGGFEYFLWYSQEVGGWVVAPEVDLGWKKPNLEVVCVFSPKDKDDPWAPVCPSNDVFVPYNAKKSLCTKLGIELSAVIVEPYTDYAERVFEDCVQDLAGARAELEAKGAGGPVPDRKRGDWQGGKNPAKPSGWLERAAKIVSFKWRGEEQTFNDYIEYVCQQWPRFQQQVHKYYKSGPPEDL